MNEHECQKQRRKNGHLSVIKILDRQIQNLDRRRSHDDADKTSDKMKSERICAVILCNAAHGWKEPGHKTDHCKNSIGESQEIGEKWRIGAESEQHIFVQVFDIQQMPGLVYQFPFIDMIKVWFTKIDAVKSHNKCKQEHEKHDDSGRFWLFTKK